MEDKKTNKLVKYDLNSPSDLVSMSNVLKRHITSNGLYTNIQGKNYAHVEGWQFAGGILGLFPMVTKVESLSSETEIKWLVEVEIKIKTTGRAVGRGFALCSNKEHTKKNFDEYSILSMAQTRAIGKAFRNLLGWVMKLSGYEATPSEEMDAFVVKSSKKTVPVKEEKPKQSETVQKIIDNLKVKTEAEAIRIINEKLELKLTKLPGNEVYLKQLLNKLLMQPNGNRDNNQKTV